MTSCTSIGASSGRRRGSRRLVVLWMLLYFGTFVFPLVWAYVKGGDVVGVVVFLLSYLAAVLLPGLAEHLWTRLRRVRTGHLTEVEVTIVTHLVLTLHSCLTIAVWGVVLLFCGLVAETPRIIALLLIFYFLASVAVIISALISTERFVAPDAYEKDNTFTWVWPATVKAPMNLVRMALSVLIFFVPIIQAAI